MRFQSCMKLLASQTRWYSDSTNQNIKFDVVGFDILRHLRRQDYDVISEYRVKGGRL